ncbi:hypothetical protein JM84_1427 [Dokdonia sp. Hel_I_63]|uniref:hypothetical protein n=1 Tax=Dokdonia sp. Hel_I_63 TaxID=1249996 RepID=UPI001199A1A1|nr:hypothetical protein [Dokdonia sp. Hel_I_63]TVZ22524.1 hypothetical protein JM84_1427 [Dokdonia sp. Hel_I_63]
MKSIKICGLLLGAALVAASCSSDDEGGTTVVTADSRAELYASSNSDGDVTVYDVRDTSNITAASFGTVSTDAEGIYYDGSSDEVTQASRSGLQLNAYGNVLLSTAGVNLTATVSSSAVLVSPRDLAVSGDFYVVSDNADVDGDPATADGRIFIFQKSGGNFTLRNTVTTEFALWGIEFVGSSLYAVVDKTSDVAEFEDFLDNSADATVSASKRITIEGIVRTHGIAETDGTMILTDIGDAGVDSDGGFHVISNFASKFDAVENGETLAVAGNQVRVAGAATFLGNPISAEYDAVNDIVYIAERANGGGRVLAFASVQAGGDLAPAVNNELAGASSLYLYQE